MSFATLSDQPSAVLLQRSLERGRLGHAYLFTGGALEGLEQVARTLAQTLNCRQPSVCSDAGTSLDGCGACLSCRKIEAENHADVQWIRPESKSRIITIEQMRTLMHTVYLKPTEGAYKVAVIVAADRLNMQAANAFLKTLEEPPARSVIILLTTQIDRVLETILSRCLRLTFGGESRAHDARTEAFLQDFGQMALTNERSGLLGRYRLLGVLLKRLAEIKAEAEHTLTARSPLERHQDIDPKLREKWEDELAAAIEAEYRRRRADFLLALQWWTRDVWLQTLRVDPSLLAYPGQAAASGKLAARLSSAQAGENLGILEKLQSLLATNVQEALALEVSLLKLKL